MQFVFLLHCYHKPHPPPSSPPSSSLSSSALSLWPEVGSLERNMIKRGLTEEVYWEVPLVTIPAREWDRENWTKREGELW